MKEGREPGDIGRGEHAATRGGLYAQRGDNAVRPELEAALLAVIVAGRP